MPIYEKKRRATNEEGQQDAAESREKEAQKAREEKRTQVQTEREARDKEDVMRIPAPLKSQRSGARTVRHAPPPPPRKVDTRPMRASPPIYAKSHKRLFRILMILVLVVFAAAASVGYTLIATENGQRLMAQWGWDLARTDAYVTLGKDLLDQAYFTRALEMLSVAVEREPENVDALIYMAQAYRELGDTDKAVEIYESLISTIAPHHPSAYRNLITIYQDRGYNAEALSLMRTASEKTDTQEFAIMLREYTPTAPTLSLQGGRYNEEINVSISIPEGETVYYTTDGTDPSEAGQVYTAGTILHVSEGKMTLKAIAFTADGVPSTQVEANYTIIIPTPAAPKANYASGKYKKAPKVSLRPGDTDEKKNKEIVAIYYTMDGRQATTESTLYTGPIQLPTGDTELRAISVAANGKISYEMRVTYSVEGNLKRMFSTDDTFKNLTLYKTTYTNFVKAYGTPLSYEGLVREEGYSPAMESYEAVYDWGTARFVIKEKNKDPVLYSLNTTNAKMTGPRSTKIGMSGKEVLNKFRDLGHVELDEYGNRLLYNWNSGGYQFGTYKYEGDGKYAIHYYVPVDDAHTIFIELSYYLNEAGTVERILWERYLAQVEGAVN